jgi:hypothetical protein
MAWPTRSHGVNGGVVAGGILIHMNKTGSLESLVAAHPGNTNAARYGVYSPRLTEPRAAEIVAELTQSYEFSVTQRIAVVEAARCLAILEAIERDLSERGVVDKRGEPRSLLKLRSRIVRELDHWLSKITPTMERQATSEQPVVPPGRSDYIRELQWIAFGHDAAASARDRVSALKELVEIDSQPGPPTIVQFNLPADRLPQRMLDRLSPEGSDGEGNATDAILADELKDGDSS